MKVYNILKTANWREFADFLYFPELKNDELEDRGLVFVCESDDHRADYTRKTPYIKNNRLDTLLELDRIVAGCDERGKGYRKEGGSADGLRCSYHVQFTEMDDDVAKRLIHDIQKVEEFSKSIDGTLKGHFPELT